MRGAALPVLAFVAGMVAQALVGSGPLPRPATPVWIATAAVQALPDATEATLEMDADILAGVAKAEDAAAAAAVQWVVLNRAGCQFLVNAPEPTYSCRRTLLEVVTEGQAFGTVIGGVYRASWWPGRSWAHPLDRAQLAEAEGTAHAILLGYVPDPTGGSTHYHRIGTWTPTWAPSPRTWRTFGAHAFYREKVARRGGV